MQANIDPLHTGYCGIRVPPNLGGKLIKLEKLLTERNVKTRK